MPGSTYLHCPGQPGENRRTVRKEHMGLSQAQLGDFRDSCETGFTVPGSPCSSAACAVVELGAVGL